MMRERVGGDYKDFGVLMPRDEELMLAVARGDLAAFAQLVARHQLSAWNAAYRFLGNAADAEDVVQEAFLRVLDSADRYRPTATFRAYLYRIVARLCLDFLRRKRLRIYSELPDIADKKETPEKAFEAQEQAAAVRQSLNLLPPKQKMAVILRYYEGLGYREIAEVLDTTNKGVERLLSRARTTLAGHLGEFLEK
jgi:RNA polymerase sigma-70 factor, ECF subfamily